MRIAASDEGLPTPDEAGSETREPVVRARRDPPPWLEGVVLVGAALLLFYPLHVPYQNPDQDLPVSMSLLELVRGGWSPLSLQYPSGLTNILRLGYEIALAVAGLAGIQLDQIDLLALWRGSHRLFRIPPRALAMAAGVVALVAVRGLGRMVGDGWTGIVAMALLGSAFGFVREHHHGMFDAPAAGAIAGFLWAAGAHARSGSRRSIVAAGALLGIGLAFKQNSGLAGFALLVALAVAPGAMREKLVRASLAGAAAILMILVLSPAALLEPARFLLFLRFHALLMLAGGDPGLLESTPASYGLADVLAHAFAAPTLVLALAGSLVAARRREWALVPLIAFAAITIAVLARSSLVLNRYALPLAPAVAVLAAYALERARRLPLLLAIAVALVALQLSASLPYLRLLATEDTRVAAARWLRDHATADAHVFFPSGPLWSAYVAPDLPRPLQLPKQIAPDLAAAIGRRLPPTFPLRWRWASGLGQASHAAEAGPLDGFAGGIVITAEHPSPHFARAMTSPALVRALAADAVLLADFPIARSPAIPTYEPRDLNFAPVSGWEILARPGPHLRIWSVAGRPTPPRAEGGES